MPDFELESFLSPPQQSISTRLSLKFLKESRNSAKLEAVNVVTLSKALSRIHSKVTISYHEGHAFCCQVYPTLCISSRTDSKFRTFPERLLTSDFAVTASLSALARLTLRLWHSSDTSLSSRTFFWRSELAMVNSVFFSITFASWVSRSSQRADLYFLENMFQIKSFQHC